VNRPWSSLAGLGEDDGPRPGLENRPPAKSNIAAIRVPELVDDPEATSDDGFQIDLQWF
jgi:hypothetical protein